jgi:hypothetical protein
MTSLLVEKQTVLAQEPLSYEQGSPSASSAPQTVGSTSYRQAPLTQSALEPQGCPAATLAAHTGS